MPAFAGMTGDQCSEQSSPLLFQQTLIKVAPLRIALLDQFEFPSSAPFLDLLFARDGINHRGVKLDIDESIDAVPLRKTLYGAGSVRPTASRDVARNAGIKRSVAVAREEIDTRTLFHAPLLSLPLAADEQLDRGGVGVGFA